jgi:redox-sensitive bicupin YhaK (pirin superfamily)
MKTLHASPVVDALHEGAGTTFDAHRLLADAFDGRLDPVLLVDHFRIAAETFAPHPHAGFSPLTYLFEDSVGSIRNRDSLGNDILVRPGDLLWTLAGRGVIHLENPDVDGEVNHGLQIWVNLAAREKHRAPEVHHLASDRVPVVGDGERVRVRVVAGASGGVHSPLVTPQAFALLDTFLAGGTFEHALAPGWNAAVYVVSGELRVEVENTATTLRPHQALALSASEDGGALRLSATGAAHAVVLGGPPLREPVVARGPFVMSDAEQLRRAIADYQSGRMGRLEPATSRSTPPAPGA